jgi:lipid-A-disaccharide synthase-like uncharacterized protein
MRMTMEGQLYDRVLWVAFWFVTILAATLLVAYTIHLVLGG